MPAGSPARSTESVTRGFRDLALRRHEYYFGLLKSGRWSRYFTEQEFAERLRDVMEVTRFWDELAEASEARASAAVDTRSAA